MQAADATQRAESLLEQPGAVFRDHAADSQMLDARHAYPDLALLQADGGWVALNVVLTPPDPKRLKAAIGRLNHERLMRAQLYLAEQDQQIEEAIKAAARDLGVGDRVHVQLLASGGVKGAD
jgi:hypothetical protein